MKDLKVGDYVYVVKCPREGRELGWHGIIVEVFNRKHVKVKLKYPREATYSYETDQLISKELYFSPLYQALL